ncbi:SMI1/KNR4 family protein [Nonomuraea sp. SBT364]|uniref:SMI1/KNR4 family protein n=1 Tax=Nonomuraea sp. SBT364 TaxID=1580530 RepID=UPI0009E9F1D5|nr:SMI1/KNR4 family protein [Nonomuraea sp. SBT364]
MWRELLSRLGADVRLFDGASEEDFARAGQILGSPIPEELKELLRESNGVLNRDEVAIIWPIDRILQDNLHFRTNSDFSDLYMNFEPLLFFADNGGGDQFAYVVQPKRFDIFVWDHENDSRQWVARRMSQYLTRRLSTEGDDWYRND